MKNLHENAPPAIRLVNELLALETDEEAQTMIRQRATELNDEILGEMKRATEQLRAGGQNELAVRLEGYCTLAQQEITAARWR